jgi:hypothetical protein
MFFCEELGYYFFALSTIDIFFDCKKGTLKPREGVKTPDPQKGGPHR